MLARLAAHINQGQMAAAGMGGGIVGAGPGGTIVIDDNCTVSKSLTLAGWSGVDTGDGVGSVWVAQHC